MATTTPTPRKGRARKGIMQTHQQISVYVTPALLAQIDALAAQEQRQTGRSTSRADVIRLALIAYVQQQTQGEEASRG